MLNVHLVRFGPYHIIIGDGKLHNCTNSRVHWNKTKKSNRNIFTFALAHKNWLMCFIFFATLRFSYWNVCNFGFANCGIIHERQTATQCALETFCEPFFFSFSKLELSGLCGRLLSPYFTGHPEIFSFLFAHDLPFIYESVVKLWFVLFRFFLFLFSSFFFIWHLLNQMQRQKKLWFYSFCYSLLQIDKLRE